MKIYVTSRQQATLDLWSSMLPASMKIEFVNEGDRRVQADALVMSGVWAFDRYGGRPNRESAQILSNTREDGLPEWIVIPPFRPIVEQDGSFVVREDFADVSPAYFSILESLRAFKNEFGDSSSVALDLPMLGMDDPRDESTPAAVARAIETFLNG
jgi:hypothetical protein